MADLPALLSAIQKALPALRAKRLAQSDVPAPERFLEAGYAVLGWAPGRTLSPRDRVTLLHGVRVAAKAWFRLEAERARVIIDEETGSESKGLFGRAAKAAREFFAKGAKAVRNTILAAWLALVGARKPTAAEIAALERQIAGQLGYLSAFERKVLDEVRALDPGDAEMYGAAVWGAAQDALREVLADGDIFVEEEAEHLSSDIPCELCQERLDAGRVPIGTLLPIGSATCLSRCHCCIFFYDANGDAWDADTYQSPRKFLRNGVLKFNQNHDHQGRFASGSGGGAAGKPTARTLERRKDQAMQGRAHPGVESHARRRGPSKHPELRKAEKKHARDRKEHARDMKRDRAKLEKKLRRERVKVKKKQQKQTEQMMKRNIAAHKRINEHFDKLAATGKKPKGVERVRQARHADRREKEARMARKLRREQRHERNQVREDQKGHRAGLREEHMGDAWNLREHYRNERLDAHDRRRGR